MVQVVTIVRMYVQQWDSLINKENETIVVYSYDYTQKTPAYH